MFRRFFSTKRSPSSKRFDGSRTRKRSGLSSKNRFSARPLRWEQLEDRVLLSATSGQQSHDLGIWISHDELMQLPTSGPAWETVAAAARTGTSSPNISNQDDTTDVRTLAKALVGVRTGNQEYLSQVRSTIMAAMDTEDGGRTLALGRNLAPYVIAADLVGLDSQQDAQFRAWLRETLTEELSGRTLQSTHEDRPNNWGTMAGASRAAVAVYLGDQAELDRTAGVFKGYLGDRSSYADFKYGSLSWQADPSRPVGINPQGAMKDGHSIDGVMPDDMRRGGSFHFPPSETGYPWEGLQGAITQAEILHRAGYDAWQWEDQALLRAVEFLYGLGWRASGDDQWQPFLVDARYGTSHAANPQAGPGKIMGWTAWTHQLDTGPTENRAPVVDAGANQTILVSAAVTLNGTVTDDGRPDPPAAVVTTWRELSGPGTVTFANASAVDTTATFSAPGTYRLRLQADDGELTASDEVNIVVEAPTQNQAPVVDAGANQTILVSAAVTLNGTVTDDGLPDPPAAVATTWRELSGPGTVTFANALAVDTTATFSAPGTYRLQLQANDGELTASDEVTILVEAPTQNRAPAVDAGPNRSIVISAAATLDGTVTDDGLPDPPAAVAVYWNILSGPGTVAFENRTTADTTARFGAPGTYVLRLHGYDGQLMSYDDVTVVVSTEHSPDRVSFQDGVSPDPTYRGTRDTRIKARYPDKNYGTNPGLQLDSTPQRGVLLKWDISAITPGSFVDAAALTIYVTDPSRDTYEIYEVKPEWVESEATWNRASSDNRWETAGAQGNADRGSTVLGIVTVSSRGPATVELNEAGVAVVQSWVDDPSSNHGLVIQDYDHASDGFKFQARETSSASNRPKLEVTIRGSVPVQNRAPVVDAGADQSILVSAAATLDGTVSDDGLPNPPAAVTTVWTQLSGPGTVTFGEGTAVDTTATFSQPGVYVLGLQAHDSELTASDRVTVVVDAMTQNQPPVVDAGADQSILISAAATLDGTVTDDGLPLGTLDVNWAKQTGPGTVTFADASATRTTAGFDVPGTYVLRLRGDDGELSAYDDVIITVEETAATVTRSFQDGQDGYQGTIDTRLRADMPTRVFGSSSKLEIDGNPDFSSLIRWDLSSIPADATVLSAAVTVNVVNSSNDVFELYAVKRPWVESEANFNQASAGTNWQVAGASGPGDRGPNVMGRITAPQTGLTTVEINADGLGAVGFWIAHPEFNHGLILQDYTNATTDDLDFSSSETSTLGNRPKFTVVYTTSSSTQNHPPVLAPIGNKSVEEGARLRFTISASDRDGDPLSYSAAGVPTGAAFNADTRTFDWTPARGRSGNYSVTFRVSDGIYSDSETISVAVVVDALPQNQSPVVDAGADQSILISVAATLDGTVTDDGLPNPPATVTTAWTKVSGPGTVTFADASAMHTTASFDVPGTYALRLRGDDGELSAYDDVIITVEETAATVTRSFQDGQDGYQGTIDTRLRADMPTRVFGSSSKLEIDGNPDFSSLIRWDLSSIPADATVLSAAVTVNVVNSSNDVFELYAVKRPWVESEANFNQASAGTNWQVAGASGPGDRGPNVMGRITAPQTGLTTVEINADGLGAVGFWIAHPEFNHGLILQDYTNATTDDLDFSSSETSTLGNRPKFTVVYTTSSSTQNHPPVLAPIGNKSVEEGARLRFTISASDRDGDPLSYSAAGVPTGAAFNADTRTFDWTPARGRSGNYSVTFRVSDGIYSDSETISIAVDGSTENQSPAVHAGSDQTVTLASGAVLDGTVTDDGLPGPLTTNWSMVSGPAGSVAGGSASDAEQGERGPFPKSGVIDVFAADETDPVATSGDAADDPAIWIHPTDKDQSLIIGTDKKSFGLGIYDLSGREIDFISDGKANNVDVRYNFSLDGRSVDLVTYTNRSNDAIEVYKVDAAGRTLVKVGSIRTGISVYGYGMYHNPTTDKFYGFANSKNGEVEQWELFDQGNGQVGGRMVRHFDVGGQVEGVVADDELGAVYLGEENVAIWKYGADPSDGTGRTEVDRSGSGGHFSADVEGLSIYYRRGGNGYLIASSQGNNTFTVYRREGNNDYLATFRIANGDVDGTSGTDGIEVTNMSLGGPYSQGMFVAQDGSNSGGNQNFKIVAWAEIADKVGLAVDTSVDVRGGQLPDPGSATVTFADPAAVDTTATFSHAGTYVLRLEASDGELTASDDVTVVVVQDPTQNNAPAVHAGSDQSISISSSATLDGTVTDDGLPNPPAAVSTRWTKLSGPGTVSFADASAVDTTVVFSTAGSYVLRLEAGDGELTGSDRVTVTVAALAENQAPAVHAGPDRNIWISTVMVLDGTVTDDGLPNPPAAVSTRWTKLSGPGTVSFADASAVDTTVVFGATGTYVLRLAASDSELADGDNLTITVSDEQPQGDGIWISVDELMRLPTSGRAWDTVAAAARTSTSSPNISNQDDTTDVRTLAKALVGVRTGNQEYISQVRSTIMAAMDTEDGGRTLALGRNLAPYVIAADLVGLSAEQDAQFRAWLRETLTEELSGRTLQSTHEDRPNNWGTMAGASRAAVAVYLGDQAELDRTAQVFKGYLGDRSSYADFKYGSLSWQADPSRPVGINPQGAIKDGHSIDGVMPDDMRRGGSFHFPPSSTGYPWEGLQGAITQAEILHRAGYDAWQWEDQALLRAVEFLYGLGWQASGDDQWQPFLLDARYGTSHAANPQAGPGKIMGWTAWTHQSGAAGAAKQTPTAYAELDAAIEAFARENETLETEIDDQVARQRALALRGE